MQAANNSKPSLKAAIAVKRADQVRITFHMLSEWKAALASIEGAVLPKPRSRCWNALLLRCIQGRVRASGPMASAIGPVSVEWLGSGGTRLLRQRMPVRSRGRVAGPMLTERLIRKIGLERQREVEFQLSDAEAFCARSTRPIYSANFGNGQQDLTCKP
jgi:hypothetical protein